jgi:hypothetical protein
MPLFGIKVGKPHSIDKEIKRAQKAQEKKERAERKRQAKEEKRQRELDKLRKGTELYTARAKHSRAKHAAKHPLSSFGYTPKRKLVRRKHKGSLHIF